MKGKLTLHAFPVVGNDATIYVSVTNHGKVATLIDEVGLRVFYNKTPDDKKRTNGILRRLVLPRVRTLAHREVMYRFFESNCNESFKITSPRRHLRIRNAESIRVNICDMARLSMFLKIETIQELVIKPYLAVANGGVGAVRQDSIMRVTATSNSIQLQNPVQNSH